MAQTGVQERRGRQARVPIETLAADFKAGLNSAQIAEKHGMLPDSVRARLNKWKPRCLSSRLPNRVRREQAEQAEAIAAAGPTFVCADDGMFYECSLLWLREWACLSFAGGLIEVLVAIDEGNVKQAVRSIPIVLGDPLIGVRVFADRNGVQRTWKAYAARPRSTAKGFPRRFIPRDQSAAASSCGVFLWRCGAHNQHLRLLELRSAS